MKVFEDNTFQPFPFVQMMTIWDGLPKLSPLDVVFWNA